MGLFLQTLPDLCSCHFGRFDFYARLVRRLEIYCFTSYFVNISDWSSLISYTRQNTLLPNLQHLLFNPDVSAKQLSWLPIFLSSSLLSIQNPSTSHDPTLDSKAVNNLLTKVALRCPALEKLCLPPFSYQTANQLSELAPPVLPFASMRNLRVIKTNMAIFDPSTLLAIGTLPQLDTLEVYEISPSGFQISAATLPNNSFPALRKLYLPPLEVDQVKTIWSMQPLVALLAVVHLELSELEPEKDAEDLLGVICQHSPQLVDLTVDYWGQTETLSPNVLQALEKLSLEKLSISGVCFLPLSDMCKTLSTACPLLRELRLPSVEASMLDLQHFALFPRLECLDLLYIAVSRQYCLDPKWLEPETLCASENPRRLEGDGYFDWFEQAPEIH